MSAISIAAVIAFTFFQGGTRACERFETLARTFIPIPIFVGNSVPTANEHEAELSQIAVASTQEEIDETTGKFLRLQGTKRR